MAVRQVTMSSMTPMDEFKKIVNDPTLTDEQLETLRDLVDAQANLILNSFMAMKKAEAEEVTEE